MDGSVNGSTKSVCLDQPNSEKQGGGGEEEEKERDDENEGKEKEEENEDVFAHNCLAIMSSTSMNSNRPFGAAHSVVRLMLDDRFAAFIIRTGNTKTKLTLVHVSP